MSASDFHWLQMRIAEEKERRDRETMILDRLPQAAAQVEHALATCVANYIAAFGPRAASIESKDSVIHVVVREETAGVVWRERSRIEVVSVPTIPGFQIDRAGSPLLIEVGLLPGEKLYYRDREKDQYLTMEELTRRILDRSMFPKLKE